MLDASGATETRGAQFYTLTRAAKKLETETEDWARRCRHREVLKARAEMEQTVARGSP